MKKRVFTIIILLVLTLGFLTGCDSKNQAEKDLKETVDKYGSVEKETVDVLVSKFNTEVVDSNNNNLNPASEDYLTIDNNNYWYGLLDGIYLVVVPKEFSNDKTKDIVDYMFIFVDKGGKYEESALSYAQHLIKANNKNITDNEVNKLLEEAKEKATDKKTANSGKGITVGYLNNTDNYQYQVMRNFKD